MEGPASGGSGPGAALSDETTIIQTRMVDETLYTYAVSIPKLRNSQGEPVAFSQAEVEFDYLSERIAAYTSEGSSSEISARNINGTLWRRPITWNLSTGSGSVGNRTQLDGGVGVYVTDFALEYDRFVTLPSADGTYTYEYVDTNEQGESFGATYIYTREGNHATLTWKSHQSPTVHLLYEGAPLTSANLGGSFTLQNPFGVLSESMQDRYLGTWTIHENLNGVTGETGQFDMRRLSVRNLEVEPANFNPADSTQGEASISFDLVTYPLTSELTPSGWTLTNGSDWMVEIAGPSSSTVVRTLTGTTPTSNPDDSGVVANVSTTWNGTEDNGEPVLNGSYQIRSRGLGLLGVANTYTKFSPPVGIQVGTRKVTIENFTADPENFDPEEGETTTLSFEIVAVGFENPSLSWEVKVYQDEELVHAFPPGDGPGIPEAEKLHKKSVSYDWDGHGADGPVTGEIEYRIKASACDGGVQPQSVNPLSHRALFQSDGGVCVEAEEVAKGNMGAAPLLEIFQSGTTNLIGSSRFKSSNPSLIARTTLGRIHEPGLWSIEARNLEFSEGEDVDQVIVDLQGLVSQVPDQAFLFKTTDSEGETVFRGLFAPGPGFILPSEQLPTKPTLSISSVFGEAAHKIFTDRVQAAFKSWRALDEEQFQRANLGRFTYFNLAEVGDDEALGDLDNLKTSLGFEGVEVTLSSQNEANSRLISEDQEAIIKVANPATYFVYSGHGGRDGLISTVVEGINIGPESLDTSKLEVLVLPSCHVLDFNNYNNYVPEPGTPQGTAPGKEWWEVNVQGTDRILLGYNALPDTATTIPSFERYINHLKNGDDHITAWLKGNLEEGGRGFRACAWDKDNYYYLSHEEIYDEASNRFRMEFNGAYYVPVVENLPAKLDGSPPNKNYKFDL